MRDRTLTGFFCALSILQFMSITEESNNALNGRRTQADRESDAADVERRGSNDKQL